MLKDQQLNRVNGNTDVQLYLYIKWEWGGAETTLETPVSSAHAILLSAQKSWPRACN